MLLAVALLPVMVLASFDFGVTWDERTRHRYGELIWEYFTGLRPLSAFGETGGHLYGGLFDVICVAVEKVVPLDRYVVRHAVNAIFGWLGVVYCGRLAGRLFGAWAGVLAMILMVASPRYFADSMNNPKDTPFAAMTVVALYYIATVSPKWPYFSPATAMKIMVALALGLNIRVGTLMYLGYFGLLVMAFVIAERNFNWRRLLDTAGWLAAVTLGVLLLGTIFWPWAQGSPLTRPIRALFGVSNFDWNGLVIFNGRNYAASELPWYYAPWWFIISTPPVVIVGAALSGAAAPTWRQSLSTAALWVIALLPLALVIFMDSTVYDGVRHLLFLSPLFVVLAAAGWTRVLGNPHAWVRGIAAVLLTAGLMNVVAANVRLHPNQGVYFNEIVGGPRGAFANYDMDYWGNCLLQAVEWSADLASRPECPSPSRATPTL
jgi:hypothetical protein